MNRFENKTAIVTGGNSGIGEEAARRLFDEGANLVLVARREAELQRVASSLDKSGDRVAIVAGDIRDPETSARAVAIAKDRFGSVDVLLNNAGVFAPKPFLEHTPDDFDHYVDIILKGKFLMAQAAAKAMVEQGGGAIVHTGSLWALQAVGATPSSAYSAANAGVHQLVKNIAIELADKGVRINAVAPAVVETPVYGTFLTEEEVAEVLPTFNAFHPLGRNGQPKDVVGALLFLASEEAAWITGTVLPVDGGVMAGRN